MLSFDVTDDASVAKLVDEVVAKALLVNNAGSGLLGGAEESSLTLKLAARGHHTAGTCAGARGLGSTSAFGSLRRNQAT